MTHKVFSLMPPKRPPKKPYTARRTTGISFKPKHLDYTIPVLQKFREVEKRSVLIMQLLDDELARIPKAVQEQIARSLGLLPHITQEQVIGSPAALKA